MDKIISEDNIEKTKKLIKSSERPIIVHAQDDSYNRKILESGNFDILLSPEIQTKGNKLKQADSGLNHVLAKIAAKNNVRIGINLGEISRLSKKEKAERISKIIQNVKICRKAKAGIVILNSENIGKEASFLLSIGCSTKQAKESFIDYREIR